MNAVQTGRQSVREPVFVICSGRSGSTLLRFLLDAHPELACPPETNMPGLCGQLATVWSLIEGAPLSPNRGDEPPKVPDAAIVGIRHTMDEMIGSYLDRRGKQRYCDKSLGTARFADLLLRVYPDAKLLCLYRHPMDVIASGLEACPWGLSGYGFDPFIAETPGNAVLALARFWTVNAAATLAVEERFPGSALRVRYEDLVADPEHEAAQIFSFLGTSPAPGISATCFSGERERFGPGDYKIWRTSRITGDSVGRGWSVPAEMIHATVLAQVNELAENLGYLPVDDGWGTSEPPRDMRAQASAGDTAEDAHLGTTASREAGPVQVASEETVGQRLRSGLSKMLADPQQQSRWGQHSLESFVTVVLPPTQANGAEYWLVDLKAGEVRQVGREAQDDSDWDIVGSAEAWEKVLRRELNINVAIRRSQLRYCDEGGERWVALDTRISILSTLLGLPAW
jgi:hypothetical protein